jgi:hypothetical protein
MQCNVIFIHYPQLKPGSIQCPIQYSSTCHCEPSFGKLRTRSPRHTRDRQDMAQDTLPSAYSGQAGHGSGQAPGRSKLLLPRCHCEPSFGNPSAGSGQAGHGSGHAPLGRLGTGRTWLRTGSGAKPSPQPINVIASPERAKQSPHLHGL